MTISAMNNLENLKIRIKGLNKNGESLAPSTCDISDLIAILNIAKNFFPAVKDRQIVAYETTEGSIVHNFKTDATIIASIVSALALISASGNLNGIQQNIIKPVQSLQKMVKKRDFEVEFSTDKKPSILKISKSTNYELINEVWVDVEMYFYGQITDLGGKNSSNIHLDTSEYGTVVIDTPKSELESFKENILYKTVGIRAIVKQNLINFEINRSKIKFCSIEPYNSEYSNTYIENLLSVKSGWSEIENPNDWLRNYRDGNE